MTRSRLRRIRRVEEAIGAGSSVDELYASIILDFAQTADEAALTLLKEAFAAVAGQPAATEEGGNTESRAPPPPPSEARAVDAEAAPPAEPARQVEAAAPDELSPLDRELRESEERRRAWMEESLSWRPPGAPHAHHRDRGDYNRPGTNGRVIVDYDPLA